MNRTEVFLVARALINGFFEVLVTRESVKRLKPHSEGITIALEKLNETKFFFVGNSSYDHLAAKDAGGTSIIIKRNKTKILTFTPEYILESLSALPPLIEEIIEEMYSSKL